jgi:dTDP-4-dehydrorhamnose 3,5-epimerase
MKFYEQEFKGVWLIESEPVIDSRGLFHRHFCQREFDKAGIHTKIVQTNISENPKPLTLRGFHYQTKPSEEEKIITCLQGALFYVVVDLRPNSNTFLKWMSVELTDKDNFSIYIPFGCANAYLTMKASTTILYYMSEFYSPGSYRGFRYNDPLFSVNWPSEPVFISEKDNSFIDFDPSSHNC